MFLNISKFTKLMKEAYKTKLVVGDLNGGTIIHSGHWLVWMDNDYIPNKIKATIMELAGELPMVGFVFEINKSLDAPQLVLEHDPLHRLIESVEKADYKLIDTKLVLSKRSGIRLFQSTKTNNIVGIPEEQFQIIDKYAINYDIEGEPTGPCYTGTEHSPLYWYNSLCTVVIHPNILEKNDLIEALEEVDFEEGDE